MERYAQITLHGVIQTKIQLDKALLVTTIYTECNWKLLIDLASESQSPVKTSNMCVCVCVWNEWNFTMT